MTPSPVLRLDGVAKRYGDAVALAPTDLVLDPGTTTALIGPSGCGKSTLLRIAAGLIEPSGGTVELFGQPLTTQNSLALRQRIGYVIQDGGLFPHLTARGNAELMSRHLGRPSRISELAELVRLDPSLLDRYPNELSGGQRQRVGIVRALMLSPELLLMDEPMGALDPLVRHDLRADLRRIHAETGTTVLLVTHDLAEAATLASRIVLLKDGAVVQDGPFAELRDRPADPFVARFFESQRSEALA